MSNYRNNISNHVISALLERIRVSRITGGDTAVLPPFVNFASPLPCTSVSCLLPYRKIPFPGMNVLIDGKSYRAESGDCLIFPEGCRRRFLREDGGHRSIWVHLRIRLEPELPLLKFFDVPHVIGGEAARRCRALMNTVNRGCRSILTGSALKVLAVERPVTLADRMEEEAAAMLLLKEILALSTPKEELLLAVEGFHELEGAAGLIRERKFEKLSLDELAACCHCSRSSFEKKFRRVFGVSPGKYLLDLRLAEAERRLRNSGDSCALIAEAAGFSNQFIFSRLFKKRYGISPRAYRERKNHC